VKIYCYLTAVVILLSGCTEENKLTLAEGAITVWASQPGKVALDGEGKNSPFTTALLEHLGNSEDIAFIIRKVRQRVSKESRANQLLHTDESLLDGFLNLSRISNGYQENIKAYALVIGNSEYKSSPLRNPVNDANAMAELLTKMNFSVTKSLNRNKSELLSDISEFEQSAKNSDITLLFYAGHGLQLQGIDYILPLDVIEFDEKLIRGQGLILQDIIERLPGKAKLFFIDASRDNSTGAR
jgi:uncharacterized caspase-like protein